MTESSEESDRPQYLIASVDSALRLILLLDEAPDIRLGGIARRLGVAPSTAHRLLSTPMWRGFIRQDP